MKGSVTAMSFAAAAAPITFIMAQKPVSLLERNARVAIFDLIRGVHHAEHGADIAGRCDGEEEAVGLRQRAAHFTLSEICFDWRLHAA